MAGTLFLTETLVWAPAGWLYDNVLESMAAVLTPDEPKLAAQLLESRTAINGGYLDLRTLDADELSALIRSADAAYREFEQQGPNSFHMPDFYPGFMNHFGRLREMLKAAHDEKAKPTDA